MTRQGKKGTFLSLCYRDDAEFEWIIMPKGFQNLFTRGVWCCVMACLGKIGKLAGCTIGNRDKIRHMSFK